MMWNERYAGEEFVYGTEPNSFLVEHAGWLRGPVLSLAEGEGRNAVFLASRGLEVLGVDGSTVGLAKAQKLAHARGVTIRTEVVDLAAYDPPENSFGAVVSIWAHLPGVERRRLHGKIERSLQPGGIFLLEAYAKAQLNRTTGGPKNPDLLLSAREVAEDFPGCETLLLRETERMVIEGRHHTGWAAVVQFIARRAD